MARRVLSPAEVGQAITKLHGHLAAIAEARLRKVAALLSGPSHRAQVSAIHADLFAGNTVDNANKSLTRLRKAVATASEDAEIDFKMCVSEGRSAGAEHRDVWFEGEALAFDGMSRTEELDNIDALISDTRGLPLQPEPLLHLEVRDGRPVVRVFISYAHVDGPLADKLVAELRSRLQVSKDYTFEFWQDVNLLPGEDWDARIREAMEECHLGLMMLSSGFLGSRYITLVEIPAFVSGKGLGVRGKRVVPVELEQLDFAHMDLRGLDKRQIYRGPGRDPEPFPGVRRSKKRTEWVAGLVTKTHEILKKYSTTESEPTPTPPRGKPPSPYMLTGDLDEIGDCLIEDARGEPTRLGESLAERREQQDSRGAPLALDYILDWLRSSTSPALFALLGEYGMGKTVTCQRLVRTIETHNAGGGEKLPLPLYFDLRRITSVRGRDEVPHLREILEECVARGWPVLGAKPTADELLVRAAQEPVLFIFDGLDEVLVHLSESHGREFTRELLRVRELSEGKGLVTRVLLSCRTHFFRTLREQDAHFTGQDRGQTDAEDYDAMVLLPLGEEQIRGYLARVLPELDVDRATELVRSVHNLEELAARPYTLKLISEQIPRLEELRARGEPVRGVTLYSLMVERWLTRDGGKHHIRPEHKQKLMSHLAAWTWHRGQRLVEAVELEEWFGAWLEADPAMRRRYQGIGFDKLEEDLRTATFLVREDDPESEHSGFRFAHTSMQEFFLSLYLFDALKDDESGRWNLANVSIETWDFFSQRIDQRHDLVARMSNWARGGPREARWLVFRFTLTAAVRSWPTPDIRGIDMTGADLKGERVRGPLDLSGSRWKGANLRSSRWHDVNLTDADFERADLRFIEWDGVRARATNYEGTRIDGAVFRLVDFEQARGGRCGCGCDFIWTSPPECWHEGARITPDESITGRPSVPTWFDGHHGPIVSCACSADGSRALSAGYDGTLRVWDITSGKCNLVLEGHYGGVNSCAWSADDARALSAGDDGTLRVWNIASGKCELVLEGHRGGVRSCAWSPDGTHLLSASDDRTLRVWNITSGECAMILKGHRRDVNSCAWSRDGTRALSASDDGTLRIWNVASGKCTRVLKGHHGPVVSCVWSGDGVHALSASFDGTLRIWNVASGKCELILEGHNRWINSCAWSADGARALSAGSDGTLRVWNIASNKCELILAEANSCALSADGARAVSTDSGGTLRVWDVATGKCEVVLEGCRERIWSCAWSANNTQALSASDDGSLRVWNVATGKCELILEGHREWVSSCALSPDGTGALSASHDGTLRVWTIASGKCVLVLAGHHGRISSCVWSADGSRALSAGDDGTLRVWGITSGKCERVIQAHRRWAMSCAWSPDGARVLSGGDDGTLRLWNIASGKCIRVLKGHRGWVMSCAWSPDGTLVLSAGLDGTLRVWNISSGTCTGVLVGHRGWAKSCVWSPDGARALSTSTDGTLRVWNIASSTCERVFEGHRGWVNSCAWSADGVHALSAGSDGTLRVWDIASTTALLVLVSLDGDHASFVPGLRSSGARFIEASPGAWRWLRWKVEFPDGTTRLLPAETFGALPAARIQ